MKTFCHKVRNFLIKSTQRMQVGLHTKSLPKQGVKIQPSTLNLILHSNEL